MPDAEYLRITRQGKCLRAVWDNAAVRKDRIALLMHWAVILVFGGGGVVLVVSDGGWMCGVPLLLLVSLIGYSMLGRRWREGVEVGPAGVTHGWVGFLAPGPRRYPFDEVREFTFHLSSDVDDDTPVLSLLRTGTLRVRVPIGFHLPVADLRRVFDAVQAFARDKHLPLKCVASGGE